MALVKLSAYETLHLDQYRLIPLTDRGTFIKLGFNVLIEHTENGVQTVLPIDIPSTCDLDTCFVCIHDGSYDIYIWDGTSYSSLLTADRQPYSLRHRSSHSSDAFYPVTMLHRNDLHLVLQVEFQSEVVHMYGWTDMKRIINQIAADPYPSLLEEISSPKDLAVSFGQTQILFLTGTRQEEYGDENENEAGYQELHISPLIREPQFTKLDLDLQCSSRITAIDVSDNGDILMGHRSGRIVMRQEIYNQVSSRIIGTLSTEAQFVRFCSIQQTLGVLAVDLFGHLYLYSIQENHSALVAIFEYSGIIDLQMLRFDGSVIVKSIHEYAVLGWDHVIPLMGSWD
jgi:hypothetical protein